MRTLALYARVSTADQSVEPQLHALRRYAEARGLAAREYVDHGHSGTKDKRPALDALTEAARRREIDAVAVVKIDRLARSVRHLTTLAGEWEALGVDLIVLDQGIDTSTPAGRLTFHVLAAIAEFERGLIIERTKAGIEAARRKGKRIGGRRVLVGRLVERIRGMREGGQSLRVIARACGISEATVRRAVANKTTSFVRCGGILEISDGSK
jgi:DNA invertase Pin-like site-specific DNA recombinase